jgi:CBS-domain-containing membrane protein
MSEESQPTLLVVEDNRRIAGIVTKTDVLKALRLRRDGVPARESKQG